jgi:hypothetical protein
MKRKWLLTSAVALSVAASALSPTAAFAAQKKGDLNNDGSVDSIDFGLLRKLFLEDTQIEDISIVDLNNDNVLNAVDFALLRKHILGFDIGLENNDNPGEVEEEISLEYVDKVFGQEIMSLEILADEEEWQTMLANAAQEEYIKVDVVVNGTKFKDVGIRPKGNSSLTQVASMNSNRYSFRLKFDKYVKDQTCFGLETLVLNNIMGDNTYMKEYVSFDIMNTAGVKAPLFCYSNVTLNGEPWGTYFAIELYGKSYKQRVFGSKKGELYNVKMTGAGNNEGVPQGGGQGFDFGGAQGGAQTGGFGGATGGAQTGGFEGIPGNTQTGGFGGFTGGAQTGGFEGIPGNTQTGGFGGATGGAQAGGFEGTAGNTQTGGFGDVTGGAQTGNTEGVPGGAQGGNFGGGQGFDFGNFDFGDFGGFGGFGGGNGGSMQYKDDNPESYPDIFLNGVGTTDEEDHQKVIAALKALSTGTDLESYFDVDAILRYLAAHTVTVNLDSFSSFMAQNYYIYERKGKLTLLPWDYNLAWGGFTSWDVKSVINFPIDTPVDGVQMSERPMIDKFLSNPEYLKKYHEYLQLIVDEYFANGKFEAKIRQIDSLISKYVQDDPSKFCTYEQYQKAVEAFIKLGTLRGESIQGQLNGTIPSTTEGQKADPSSLLDCTEFAISDLGTMSWGFGGGDWGNWGDWGGADWGGIDWSTIDWSNFDWSNFDWSNIGAGAGAGTGAGAGSNTGLGDDGSSNIDADLVQ